MAEQVAGWIERNIIAVLAMLASAVTTLITLTVLYTHIQDTVQGLKDEFKAQHETNVSVDSRLNTLTQTAQGITHTLEMANAVSKERAKWEADHLQPAVLSEPRKR